MKHLRFFILFAFTLAFCACGVKNDNLLEQLNTALSEKDHFVALKEARIAKLKQGLRAVQAPEKKFELYKKLYVEYRSFRYDSAYFYSKELLKIAQQINDPGKIASSKMAVSFTLLSSGMFNETLGILNKVDIAALQDTDRVEYYFLKGRCYFDWADFDHNEDYSQVYREKAIAYIDSSIAITKPYSYYFYTLSGLKNLRLKKYSESGKYYEKAINTSGLSPHESAVTGCTLSYIYQMEGKGKQSEELLIKAAIADIKTATKETVAIYQLANYLYKRGDETDAFNFINEAIDEANFYGARHRQAAISNILPIIEAQRIKAIEDQRRSLVIYSSIITLLIMAIIGFVIIIKLQLKKLRAADVVIQAVNKSLKESNEQLELLNSNLSTANKIKNEYISYYFNIISVYIEKLGSIKNSLERKLKNHLYEDAMISLNNINLNNERNELFNTFDKVFLGIFPSFLKQFNSMFATGDMISIPDGYLLSPEHRIFAFIRMGIHDNDRIAKLLGYSVNTIYAYKNRVKTKSNVPNDEFEELIMAIEPV